MAPPTFLSLPAEIQLEILSHLDLESFSAVRHTNRHFGSDSMLVRRYLLMAERRRGEMFRRRQGMVVVLGVPCYGCLRVLRPERFTERFVCGSYYFGGERCGQRVCRECFVRAAERRMRVVALRARERLRELVGRR